MGEKIKISIAYNNVIYMVDLINQHFDESKYSNHKNILQMRYSPSSKFSKMLKYVFKTSYEYLLIQRQEELQRKKLIKLPDDIKEYIALYQTEAINVFRLETITSNEVKESMAIARNFDELMFERVFYQEDKSSSIVQKEKLVKIRRLDYTIISSLKKFYNYSCQVCGTGFVDKYNVDICEGHHIEYFSLSLNNDSSNIIILCPNHHSVIHKAEPIFNRKNLLFEYGSGFTEKIRINQHL